MSREKIPSYYGEIDLSRFSVVEPPQDKRKVLAIGISESGYLAMNERFLAVIKKLNVEFQVSDDKRMILIGDEAEGSYTFPKSGRIKDEQFVQSVLDAGLAVPCRYIMKYSDDKKLWVGEYTDILGNGKQSLQQSVSNMIGKSRGARKKNAR